MANVTVKLFGVLRMDTHLASETLNIEKVADRLLATGQTEISRADFDDACRRCGIRSDLFTQDDLDRLQQKLNK